VKGKISLEFDRQVYPGYKMCSRFMAPTMIYIPEEDLVRKMIKVCIKLKKPEELLLKLKL